MNFDKRTRATTHCTTGADEPSAATASAAAAVTGRRGRATNRVRSRAAAALVALASVIGLAAAVAPPASAAGSGTLSLRLVNNNPYQREVTVQGTFPMSQQKAQDVLSRGASMTLKFWGEDPWLDDLMAVRYLRPNVSGTPVYLFLTDGGLGMYYREVVYNSDCLDEDPEGWDEVYVGVTLASPQGSAGKTVGSFRTSTIYGNF